jgi:hypothetical protein
VQGNLGALLLSADRPADAITELRAALQLGRQLTQQQQKQQVGKKKRGKHRHEQQQHQQQQKGAGEGVQQQLGGLMFNLGKALTSLGR